ncbi:succinylglutamate desuccinylase [Alteromonas gilva]|uniref:Succinylglutamate desuccinylase n=1 Tax=Alteromonas gilva TaxID=2987522 RepID=A0ABT5L3P7_9ALTE|nr:succinylglutamate desuccinylase [Alteromonas gilva]MDC8831497.1 succinylglutamate desuccinylase [Alteromonas gilva]
MDSSFLANGQFLHLSRFQPETFANQASLTLPNHTTIDILAPGIVEVTPASQAGKFIVLSCGVHGNETAPIEICSDMLDAIVEGTIIVQHKILMIFGNLPAMNAGERFIEENMNRLFSGAHQNGSSPERQRAKLLEDTVAQFFAKAVGGEERLHYDLHTAIRDSKNDKFVVMPYLGDGRLPSAKQFGFLAACGVDTFLLSSAPTTTFSYFSSAQFKARGFTVELGKVRPFGENDMRSFAAARASLTALVSETDYAPAATMSELLVYKVNQVINRQHKDFALHFSDDAPNFTDFKQGTLLASEPGAEYVAQQDGEAIVFPNAKVALGQRALLTVVPTTLETLDV